MPLIRRLRIKKELLAAFAAIFSVVFEENLEYIPLIRE